jgi:hypothetical protein
VNSLENAAERVLFDRQIRQTRIDHPPLFILGHWRSGTTLLHNLLSLDSQVTFPNLYQCMFPGHFLLTENIVAPLTGWLLPRTRPMDNVAVGWKEPQEEDVAMALSCGISPYLMTAFHDRPELYGRYFDPRDMNDKEHETWKACYLRLMQKLTLRKNASIVSKNPANTFRIPMLLEMFPEARFVYIRRDPYAVYQSTMHLRRTMFTENALGPPRLQTAHEDTLQFYEKCIRTYEADKSLIPKGRLRELRFEDLEANPLRETEKIYRSLLLPNWEQVEPQIRAQLPTLKSYRKNAFRMDSDLKRTIFERLQWVFELYDYQSRLDDEGNLKPLQIPASDHDSAVCRLQNR